MTETAAAAQTETSRPPRLLPGRSHDLSQAERTARAAAPADAGGELSFGDLLDVINPLQHLPIIGSIYRALTHDEISPAARVAGGFLYGGPIGAAAGMVGAIAEEVMGEDPGVALAERVFGTEPPKAVAAAETTPSPAPAAAPVKPVSLAMASPAPADSAAKPLPRLSPAAFEALLQATGAVPESPAPAAATVAAPEPSALQSPVADGPALRFFPAHAVGAKAPRAVPLSLPAGVQAAAEPGYDAALGAMQRNLDRYRAGTAASSLPAP